MAYFCLTVDLDRDVNLPVPGRIGAGSLDRGQGDNPRYSSSEKGLARYIDLLDELSIPATFFAESTTLEHVSDSASYLHGYEVGVHGYEHEDFSLLDIDEAEHRIGCAISTIIDITGTCPKSFRAPYMSKPSFLDEFLVKMGVIADSSCYSDEADYGLESSGLVEVPVSATGGSSGVRKTGYMWPMHEGKRGPKSYIDMAGCDGSTAPFVIADHTWHIEESRAGGLRDKSGAARAITDVRTVLTGLLDRGYRPKTISELARDALL